MQGAIKWHVDKLVLKLEKYNSDNAVSLFQNAQSMDDRLFPTQKFFQQNKTEVFEMDANGNQYEMFESMRIYIERFGRPYNYLKSVNYLNEQREKALLEEEEKAKEEAAKKEAEESKALQAQKAALEKLAEERLVSVMAHMKELEDCDDLNMRQFLMKYIIPLLTEGMIEVWKVGPLDPVDYLAEYIFKKSQGA
jgi:adenylate kinase